MGARTTRPGGGQTAGDLGDTPILTRYRSAAVAMLACASLLAATFTAEAARRAARSTHSAPAKTTDKSADKAANPAAADKAADKPGKAAKTKAAKEKSKESKSRDGGVPQIPLAQGPVPETPESQVALVKGSIEALRSGGASKATGVAAAITDPAARKLV